MIRYFWNEISERESERNYRRMRERELLILIILANSRLRSCPIILSLTLYVNGSDPSINIESLSDPF
jgi:hypothetical protein